MSASEVDPFSVDLALNLLGNVGGGGILRVISSHFPPISFLVPVTTSMGLRGPRTIEEGNVFCKAISGEEITFIVIQVAHRTHRGYDEDTSLQRGGSTNGSHSVCSKRFHCV